MDSKPTNSNTISSPSIELPKGGGAIKGLGETFQPNVFSGTGSYSIPIPITPARGFEPQLSITYNSGSGNSEFGVGFSLSLPKISIRTEKGIPRYDGNDIFTAGSGELVPKRKERYKDENGWNVIEYLPRIEGSFSLIEHHTKEDKSESYWKITSNNNEISFYGLKTESRIYNPDDASQIFEWLIDKSVDAKGNKITYTYKAENNDGISSELWEQGRSFNNKYIQNIKYGNYKAVDNKELFAFEVVFDYGEYDISALNKEGKSPYDQVKKWNYRPDAFSSYKSGFEIRTCRVCYNILLFHCFKNELGDPCLVKSMGLDYEQSYSYGDTSVSGISIIRQVILAGYKRNGNKGSDPYEIQQLPPVMFGFSRFYPPQKPEFKKLLINGDSVPGYLNASGFQPVDLHCEGITGLLYNSNNSVFYCEPQGNGEYSKPLAPQYFPIDRDLKNGDVSLVDLESRGELELVVTGPGRTGFYQMNSDGSWNNYQPFESYPTDYASSDLEMVGLNGNGTTDILLVGLNDIRVYPSIGKKGYAAAENIEKPVKFPLIKKTYKKELVGFANLLGDGLSHRIKISDGCVECWPCLGYGRFGTKITLGKVPCFGQDFDISRVFLADIDGSGTTDIIYAHPDKVELYLNNSGNSFSDAITVYLPETYSTIDQISFSDIRGNGTTCLVFTKIAAVPRHYYYDFVGEIVIDGQMQKSMKPYLLNEIDNNMGAVTQMQYCSSVKFYLEDKRAGNPWITKLPFPVQVIEKTIQKDLINGSRYTSLYKYHDGYFDHEEKEFRGFGYVETWDSEDYKDYQHKLQNQDTNIQEIDTINFVPPTYTRTWHHTGAFFTNSGVSNQYKQQYFQGDKNAYNFPDSVFNETIYNGDAETLRQAYVAMSGHVIRTEVYSDDNTKFSKNPYTVEESNVEVKLYQPRGENRYAVYMVNQRESTSYHYERNPNDPRVQQTFSLEADDFGNVLQSCNILLPRRANNITGAKAFPEQLTLKAIIEWHNYMIPLSGYLYCHDACEEQSLEINGIDLHGNMYFSLDEIKKQLLSIGLPNRDKIVLYDKPFSDGVQARQITWIRHYFWNDEQTDALPLGNISTKALLHHSEQAVFTKDFTIDVFDGSLIDAAGYDNNKYLSNILYSKGGYFYDLASTYWWNKGLVQHYFLPDQSACFAMPCKTENTFAINTQIAEQKQDTSLCSRTSIGYDDYYLSPVTITEEIDAQTHNTVTAVIDYVTSQPKQLTDSNNNVNQALFDPLGQVIVTSLFGTENGIKTGGMTLYPDGETPAEYQLKSVSSFDDIWQNPQKYLQGASSYFYYELTAWTSVKQPSRSINLVSFNYYHSPDKENSPYCQILVNYSDGLGRELEKKLFTGTQWQVSGRTVYNNKAKPFEQYLPYFSDSPDYEDQKDIPCPPPTVTHYDPLLRPVRIDTPKGFFTKVAFTPWEEVHFDENDTVLDSEYYKNFIDNYPANPTQQQKDEKDALDKSAKFYNTPEIKVVDNTGSIFLDIQTMEDARKLTSYTETDILGRVVTSVDPRLYASNLENKTDFYNLRYRYPMGEKQPVLIDSVDAGTARHLFNIFGPQLWSWSARNYCQLICYDKLQRKSAVLVKKIDNSGPVVTYDDFNRVEAFTYGESQADAENKNLRGQLYQLNDLSGVIINAQYSIQAEVLQTSRQMTVEYKTAANWNNPVTLEDKIYSTIFTYNALKHVLTETTPDNSVTSNNYNLLGLLNTVSVTYKDGSNQKIVDSIAYDAKLQRTSIAYGNGINTSYTYEDTTLRLIKLYSKRLGQNTGDDDSSVQDISYTYDPVGNITRTCDNTFETVFNNNQQVDPLSDYTYDALYQLIKANGRQHLGINANTYKNNKTDNSFKQCIFSPLPSVNDADKLENYCELYTYDDSGNFVKKQHIAASSSYTRETLVADNSNRLKNFEYDASGNQRQLDINKSVTLSYNCCENLVKTGIIERPDELDDCDYYLYDSSEMRTRKVSERMAHGESVTEITEKTYLGNYEIKRNKSINAQGTVTTTLERQTLRVMDDKTCIAIIHYWVKDDLKREVDTTGERSTRFQMGNNLGSVSLEMDANASLISYEEYFPYGGTAIIAGKNQKGVDLKDYRYSGKERDDSTGMYYYGARYYIPWLGRWNKPDPAGTVDGLNLYAFVGGNPITHKDIGGYALTNPFDLSRGSTSLTAPHPKFAGDAPAVHFGMNAFGPGTANNTGFYGYRDAYVVAGTGIIAETSWRHIMGENGRALSIAAKPKPGEQKTALAAITSATVAGMSLGGKIGSKFGFLGTIGGGLLGGIMGIVAGAGISIAGISYLSKQRANATALAAPVNGANTIGKKIKNLSGVEENFCNRVIATADSALYRHVIGAFSGNKNVVNLAIAEDVDYKRLGIQYSKAAIDYVFATSGASIHFHLDGLVNNAPSKEGGTVDFSPVYKGSNTQSGGGDLVRDTVTAHELRYLARRIGQANTPVTFYLNGAVHAGVTLPHHTTFGCK